MVCNLIKQGLVYTTQKRQRRFVQISVFAKAFDFTVEKAKQTCYNIKNSIMRCLSLGNGLNIFNIIAADAISH